LLAQAPIIALMLLLGLGVSASEETAPNFANTITTLFLLSISAIWFGCSNAAREIVSEWAIYRRERMVNLKIPSYVASKFSALGGFCFLQCAALVLIVHSGAGLKSSPLLMLFALTLASFVGLALGLAVSALARTSEVAIGLIPVILIPMVIFGGLLSKTHLKENALSHATDPVVSRWTFEALLVAESDERACWKMYMNMASQDLKPKAIEVDCNTGQFNSYVDPNASSSLKSVDQQVQNVASGFFPKNKRTGIAASLAILALMLAALTGAIMLTLRLRDVH
jgi:hypothetical protein